ncbi:MAG: heavy metal-associated domain-containing protein, partial [Verrucomicrobiota bacterium]
MPATQTAELKSSVGASQKAAVTELSVTGMTCDNCARHVTETLQGVTGVRSASVNLHAKHASVRWAAGVAADVAALERAVKEAGYDASPASEEESHEGHEHAESGWQMNLWLG